VSRARAVSSDAPGLPPLGDLRRAIAKLGEDAG
jgi:hypothetical protein